ncbi:hypothetical protein [Anaerovorax sp. IOR16]|uniref:hypothetical protein n=1 Tax=Anaerovorax sp. IOR16 TaxID=2773458 RepID=UPI0019D0C3FE|nr:hypothetical protein [Anaerovorax sp. IOR16]
MATTEVSLLLGIGLVAYMFCWLFHYCMCADEGMSYGYATFSQFINVFNSCKGTLKYKQSCPNSIFICKYNDEYTYECYIHNGIIKFNEQCMIIKPYDYWRFVIWKYNYIKPLKPKRINWEWNYSEIDTKKKDV